jgi:hypothetical protein
LIAMREAMLALPDSPTDPKSMRALLSQEVDRISKSGHSLTERWIPRQMVETITGIKRSTITLYYRKHNIGCLDYNKATKRLGLMYSIADVENMLTLFKNHTATQGRRQAQLNKAALLWWEFTQRIIRRIDTTEETISKLQARIWALEHPAETRELEDRKNEEGT